jgi:quercetin dioxygenase-like cupin family protein
MPTTTTKGYLQLDRIPPEQIAPLISRRVVAGEKGMLVFWSMKAGAHAAAHRHPHEQIFWVLKGTMEFRLGDEKRTCRVGDMGVIPGGVEHEAWFPEDTEVIDVFSPPREDFLVGGAPAYMRRD